MAVVGSRLFIYLLGSIWSLYFTDGHTLAFHSVWQQWDAGHYLFIAENGYVAAPHEKAVLIAFFPLYPYLIKGFGFIFRDYSVAGYFVSTVSLMAACYFLYKLVKEQTSPSVAAKAVLFLIISPFSVFLGLVFTESLFLALVIAFFYALKKQRWLIAGTIGFFAALTKNQGILLLIPYLMEALVALVHQPRGRQERPVMSLGLKTLTPVLLILAGLAVYILINYRVTGNPFQFLAYQKSHWHNSFGFFAENIRNMLLLASSFTDYEFRFSLMVLQPIVFMFALFALCAAVVKKIPPSINAFSLAFLLVSFSPTWLLSGARYSTALFYIPMLLAIVSTTTSRLIVLSGLSMSLMCFFVIVYVEGAMF
ncbi:MAG: glycosyltransferase family 39 protein [Desulfobacterales bacterium]|nr:glycosyltransferase family 39 protein [Desulfobacterales bacterium]